MPYANPEDKRRNDRKYRLTHKRSAKEYLRRYYLANKERILERTRKWGENARKNSPWVVRRHQNNYFRRKREKILSLLGNKCRRCGFSDPRALQIDHINGTGYLERRKHNFRNRATFLNEVIKSVQEEKEEFQILCSNCNWIKRVEKKEDQMSRKYDRSLSESQAIRP